ncbi:asparagine synthase (glutamine-hydrolyzing) [Ramlibacter tataouinensis]|uniref:asparagine synthase (glutamine-hydrolyzing) n=1 Tax=Ramlibacter tataouinensis TaxID=94132 RepID=UPI0022F3E535|nr:asparagine synthase (glutamine-hydrolyzing) [Ramlibacter tataouinensis]WBY00707.1 asparagine synthase (glutamine-hydrolyzing) [Ramlibacter tataouinensis]
MCGIAGLLKLDGSTVDPMAVDRMGRALAHRGPDGEGRYVEGPIGFAHRRLAIIDLTPAAAQPFSDPSGRFTVVYNGELYNYRELRRELISLGRVFRTASDTEVLLEAFKQWGPGAVQRFNGMFAFAIWDRAQRRLFLARDRYGVKPLYTFHKGGEFLFASEPVAITQHANAGSGLAVDGLVEYLTFQNFFSDRTIYRDVRMFPAGCWGSISPEQGELVVNRYWDFNFVEQHEVGSEAETCERLRLLLNQAVSRQLVSDVEVGAYLSGGIDSGCVTALAARQLPYLKSFTCGFDLHSANGIEVAFDERERAEHMSYLYKTEHYEMVLKSGDMERVMPKLMRHMGEPRVGQSYPNYYVAGLASKFVKVVLTGTGGDELFGGYPWRYYTPESDADFDSYVDGYYGYWQRLVPPELMPELLAPVWSEAKHVDTRDLFKSVFGSHPARLRTRADYVNSALYFEAKTFLHGLLVVEDKLSMAHGLESRVPFLDNDLVDYAMTLPVSMKLAARHNERIDENMAGPKTEQFFQQTHDGKLILRQAVEEWMPKVVTQAAKQGFSAPDASWFRGESLEYVKRCLLRPAAKINEVLNPAVVARLLDEHMTGQRNRRLLIWSLLCLEHSDFEAAT